MVEEPVQSHCSCCSHSSLLLPVTVSKIRGTLWDTGCQQKIINSLVFNSSSACNYYICWFFSSVKCDFFRIVIIKHCICYRTTTVIKIIIQSNGNANSAFHSQIWSLMTQTWQHPGRLEKKKKRFSLLLERANEHTDGLNADSSKGRSRTCSQSTETTPIFKPVVTCCLSQWYHLIKETHHNTLSCANQKSCNSIKQREKGGREIPVWFLE